MFGDSDYLNENFVTTLGQCYAILSAAQPFPSSMGEEWPCDICGDVFGSEDELENHTAEHYKEICSKSPTRTGPQEWGAEHNIYTQANGSVPQWRTEQFSDLQTSETLPICRESKNDWVSYLMEHEEEDVEELQICTPLPEIESYESNHNLIPQNDNSRTPPISSASRRETRKRTARPKGNPDGSTSPPKKRRGRPPGSRNKTEKTKCPFDCGATVAFSGLIRHVRLYHGEHLCKCDVCGKLFYRLDDLQAHRDTHKSGGPYICRFCSKPFKRLSHLKEHETVHSREVQMSDAVPGVSELNRNMTPQNGDCGITCMVAPTGDINQVCTMNPMEYSESYHFRQHEASQPSELQNFVPGCVEGESKHFVTHYKKDHITSFSNEMYTSTTKSKEQPKVCHLNGQDSMNSSELHTSGPVPVDSEFKHEDRRTVCNCVPACEKPPVCSTKPEKHPEICHLNKNEEKHSRDLQMSASTHANAKSNSDVIPKEKNDRTACTCMPACKETHTCSAKKEEQPEICCHKGNEAEHHSVREFQKSSPSPGESKSYQKENRTVCKCVPTRKDTYVCSAEREEGIKEFHHREHETGHRTQLNKSSLSTAEEELNHCATLQKELRTHCKCVLNCEKNHVCYTETEECPKEFHHREQEAEHLTQLEKSSLAPMEGEMKHGVTPQKKVATHCQCVSTYEEESNVCPTKPEEHPEVNYLKEHEAQILHEVQRATSTPAEVELKCGMTSQKGDHRTTSTFQLIRGESDMRTTKPEEHSEAPAIPRKKKRKMRTESLKHHGDIGVENPRSYDRVKCPFECGATVRYSGLSRHIRRHTGERPYKCNSCDESFQRADDLQVHKYKHTGGVPYTCRFCGRGFNWPSHLKSHEPRCSPESNHMSASFANQQNVHTRSSS